MSRVAAVDCGTNSIRLLVADIDPGATSREPGNGSGASRVRDVVRRMEIVRLGQGIDRTGTIAPDAMARTLARVREYAEQCRQLGAERVRFVATSASRDARNAGEFVAGVHDAFGDFDVTPEVVSGDEEAELSFRGATAELRRGGAPGPYLVVDLGGGSTEFVRGTETADQARSTDVGSVRMTERHLASDPPTPEEVAAATGDVDEAIARAAEVVDFHGVAALVGLAGSVTTITAQALALSTYDPRRIHGARLSAEEAVRACSELLAMTHEQRAALPFMHPGRVDVIGGGALVWRRVVQRVTAASPSAEVITSEHDILDGIALSIA